MTCLIVLNNDSVDSLFKEIRARIVFTTIFVVFNRHHNTVSVTIQIRCFEFFSTVYFTF